MNITKFSLKHHIAVLLLCVGIVIVGLHSYYSMPRENEPEIKMPYIIVSTFRDGANPADMEASITIPIESKLDGLEGLKEMRSTSDDSFSVISLEFMPNIDIQVALNRVRDAVDQAKPDIDPEADEPVVKEFSLSSVPVLIYHFMASDKIAVSELYEMAENLRDKIEQIPGVLEVEIFGGRERDIIIEVDPVRLHYFHLPLSQVQGVLAGTNRNISAGVAEGKNSRIVMRVPGEFENPADIFNLVIGGTSTGTPIYMHDVAKVYYGFEDERSRARLFNYLAKDGINSKTKYVSPRPAISLHIKKRPGANILSMCDEVAKTIRNSSIPNEVTVVKGLDTSKVVNEMVTDLENGIGTSLVLVLLVIFIGLGFRNSMLVASAIPFSMLTAIIILKALGQTLNMMVLFSLILALGMLVDNAIVIIENIHRHYSLGTSRIKSALIGTSEVAWPVITSTATTVAAFLPLVFWPGIMGEFMSFLPKTVIIVLLSSLFVALVINPTLCAIIMKRPKHKLQTDPENHRPTYWLVQKYKIGLEFLLNRPYWTIATIFITFIFTIALYAYYQVGVEFLPDIDPDMVTCNITPPEGISLQRSDKLATELEDRLFGKLGSGYNTPVKNIKYANVVIGVAGSSGGAGGFQQATAPITIQIEFIDREARQEPSPETIAEMRRRIAGIDKNGKQILPPLFGADFNVVKQQEGPPTGKDVSIDIFGEDLNKMSNVIVDMKHLMQQTLGTVKPIDDATTAQPTINWRVDRARAGMVGLQQANIGSFLQIAVGGLHTGTFGHGDDEQDILLRMDKKYRLDTNYLRNITIPTAFRGSVPISEVASAQLVPGPLSIKHLDGKRVLNAGCEVEPQVLDKSGVRKAFQNRAKKYQFPPSITYKFGGTSKEEEDAKAFLSKAFLIAIFLIIMVMVIEFNSIWISLIVMCSVILSLIGVLWGLLVLHVPFGIIMSGIGIISLAGIVVNNAIVLLDAIRQFEARGETTKDAVISAAMIRFRPVLLTAITTILGLVPMALRFSFDFKNLSFVFNSHSSQWWQSMATTVIFGLLIATILTLGIVPTLYLLYEKFHSKWNKITKSDSKRFGSILD